MDDMEDGVHDDFFDHEPSKAEKNEVRFPDKIDMASCSLNSSTLRQRRCLAIPALVDFLLKFS